MISAYYEKYVRLLSDGEQATPGSLCLRDSSLLNYVFEKNADWKLGIVIEVIEKDTAFGLVRILRIMHS